MSSPLWIICFGINFKKLSTQGIFVAWSGASKERMTKHSTYLQVALFKQVVDFDKILGK